MTAKEFVELCINNLNDIEMESKKNHPADGNVRICIGFTRQYITEVAEKNGILEEEKENDKQ